VYLVDNLQAATLFTVIALFQLMRLPVTQFPISLSAISDVMQALDRLENVLMAETQVNNILIDRSLDVAIKVEHASWTWDSSPKVKENVNHQSKYTSGGTTKEKRGEEGLFQLHDIHISIPHGALVAVVGATGSGKSSLLSGLVNEMRRLEGNVTFAGTTSVVPQTPWILAATIRENILFGLQWDEERYWQAVHLAYLEHDLEMLSEGDATAIGEKGINLSVSSIL
jgi:ABC-type multidrug transport system fused ATPase/permease subunit